MKKNKQPNLIQKIFGTMAFLSAVIFCGTVLYLYLVFKNAPSEITVTVDTASSAKTNSQPEAKQTVSIPNKANIAVPFLVQAPQANWDALHEEACEETSLIMYKHFLEGSSVSADQGEKEIQDIVAWETANGYKQDVTIEELAKIAEDYFHLKGARVKTGATVDDIKYEISQGRPVIVPAAGKILPNPNFRAGGPLYHMLVVKGYDNEGFIANDPGTRKGEGFRYTYDGLFNAIHNWSEPDIMQGAKAYLVFDK